MRDGFLEMLACDAAVFRYALPFQALVRAWLCWTGFFSWWDLVMAALLHGPSAATQKLGRYDGRILRRL